MERSTGNHGERKTPDSIKRLVADTCPGGLFLTPPIEIKPLHTTPVYKEIVPTVKSLKSLKKQLDTHTSPVDTATPTAQVREDIGTKTERLKWMIALANQSERLPRDILVQIMEDAKHQEIDLSEEKTEGKEPVSTLNGETIIFSDSTTERELVARTEELNTLSDFRQRERVAAADDFINTVGVLATELDEPERLRGVVNSTLNLQAASIDSEEVRTEALFIHSMRQLGMPNDQILAIWDTYRENASGLADRKNVYKPGEEK